MSTTADHPVSRHDATYYPELTTEPIHPPANTARPDATRLRLRNLTVDDLDAVAAIVDRVYANLGGAWAHEKFLAQQKRFPEG